MRRLLLLPLLLCGTAVFAQAPAPAGDPYPALHFLKGQWIAAGPAAAGSGHFAFFGEVQKNVLIRSNHAEYPAANGRPATVHDDPMVIYHEGGTRAIYFDNEGHMIHYAVETGVPDTATFVSESAVGAPRYRLSYKKLPDGRLSGKLEIAPPGKPEEFKTDLEWTAKRK